jgi:hypothetical protein
VENENKKDKTGYDLTLAEADSLYRAACAVVEAHPRLNLSLTNRNATLFYCEAWYVVEDGVLSHP